MTRHSTSTGGIDRQDGIECAEGSKRSISTTRDRSGTRNIDSKNGRRGGQAAVIVR